MLKYILFIFGVSVVCPAYTHGQLAVLQMRVSANCTSSADIVIEFELANASDAKVTLYRADIPWLNLEAIRFVLVSESIGNKADFPVHYPGSPVSGDIDIPPRGCIRGTAKLSSWYPKLVSRASGKMSLLFWAYNIPGATHSTSGLVCGGVLQLPVEHK